MLRRERAAISAFYYRGKHLSAGWRPIGAVTTVLEEGLVYPHTDGRAAVEAPVGRVCVEYNMVGPYVKQVKLFNVASCPARPPSRNRHT